MKKKRIFPIAIIAMLYLFWRIIFSPPEKSTIHLQGTTMGPIPYSVKYIDKQNRSFQAEVDSLLIAFNNSLSTYIPESEVSRFNSNDSLYFETPFFYPILKSSDEVYKNSNGAFDPTIGPLSNAWGFGPKENISMDSTKVDSLMMVIGFDKIRYNENYAVKNSGMYLDFSAVAKGYGIDVIGDFLASKGIENYMVEIGGEVNCKGKNQLNDFWSIGIEKPVMDISEEGIIAIAKLENKALATSGNYRNYYLKDGKIISHTISPYTGYPISHNLLSASIFADNCTLADAYATACMVMGLDASKKMVNHIEGIECVLIYSDQDGQRKVYISDGISSKIELLQE